MSPSLAELVAPNLHVALIHYPLALLAVGLVIEVLAVLWPRSTARSAARWMIGIGVLSAVPAAFSGIYALRQVARVDQGVDRPWADVRTASPVLSDPATWQALKTHTLVQSIATAAAALAVVVWLGCSDRGRRFVYAPVLGVLILSIAAMGVGAWYSGEAIYKHGTGVEVVGQPTDTLPPMTKAEQLFPPVELHTIGAGTMLAVALAAIGLSFRKLAVTTGPAADVGPDFGSTHVARSFNPNLEVAPPVPPLPVGKFWLAAFAVAVATSLGGWLVLARASGAFETAHDRHKNLAKVLWEQVAPDVAHGQRMTRPFAHLLAGGTIIGLPLVLAGLSRWAPHRRLLLAAVTLLLVGAVAAQVWFGILLLYDKPDGPLQRFNAAEDTRAAAPPVWPAPSVNPLPAAGTV